MRGEGHRAAVLRVQLSGPDGPGGASERGLHRKLPLGVSAGGPMRAVSRQRAATGARRGRAPRRPRGPSRAGRECTGVDCEDLGTRMRCGPRVGPGAPSARMAPRRVEVAATATGRASTRGGAELSILRALLDSRGCGLGLSTSVNLSSNLLLSKYERAAREARF